MQVLFQRNLRRTNTMNTGTYRNSFFAAKQRDFNLKALFSCSWNSFCFNSVAVQLTLLKYPAKLAVIIFQIYFKTTILHKKRVFFIAHPEDCDNKPILKQPFKKFHIRWPHNSGLKLVNSFSQRILRFLFSAIFRFAWSRLASNQLHLIKIDSCLFSAASK